MLKIQIRSKYDNPYPQCATTNEQTDWGEFKREAAKKRKQGEQK